jgi:hypothetical protein
VEIVLTHHVRCKLEIAFISEEQIAACIVDADAVESARLSGSPPVGLRLQRDFAQGTLIAIVRQSGEQISVITAWWNSGDRRGKPMRRRPR